MAATSYLQPGPRRTSPRQRAGAMALTVAAHLLVLLLLLRLAPAEPPPPERREPSSFALLPDRSVASASPRAARAASTASAARASAPPRRANPSTAPAPAPAPAVPPAPATTAPSALLPNGSALFEAADIGKLPTRPDARSVGGGSVGGVSGVGDSVAAYGPGEGPGGERLYNAEWFREPSRAELGPYLPGDAPVQGWGMIACRTAPDYRVGDCRTLGESPLGSGLARGLRLAAWQFRVRPPRIGGRAVVGAWVRIRIDFSATGARQP